MVSLNVNNAVHLTVAVDTVLADAQAFSAVGFDRGTVINPAGSTVTTITWNGSHDGTNYVAVEDSSSTAVTNSSLAASQSQPLPTELFDFPYVKGVSNLDGSVEIILKRSN